MIRTPLMEKMSFRNKEHNQLVCKFVLHTLPQFCQKLSKALGFRYFKLILLGKRALSHKQPYFKNEKK